MKLLKKGSMGILTRLKEQTGFGLAETLVAVALLGTAVVAFIAGISTGSLSVNVLDEETQVQQLARSQMEYTKSYAYNPGATSYPTISVPSGYSLNVAVGSVAGTDADIQKITVTVLRDSQVKLTLSDYKLNR